MKIKINELIEKYKGGLVNYFISHKKSLVISLSIALASLLLPTIPYINLIFPEKFTGAIVLFLLLIIVSQRILAAIFSLTLCIGFFIYLVDPSSTEVLGYALLIVIVASIIKSFLENQEENG